MQHGRMLAAFSWHVLCTRQARRHASHVVVTIDLKGIIDGSCGAWGGVVYAVIVQLTPRCLLLLLLQASVLQSA